jgi:phage shock protein PspC (stress-responsive transcriptional regulator)
MTSAPPPAPPPAPPFLDPPYYGPPPPPPPPGPPIRGQLRRSRTDKVIGGVAGGLARYSGIDPLLWRVGFVALAFAGGTGVLVYLLLWLLMPATAESAVGYAAAAPVEPAVPAGPRSPVPGVTVAAVLIAMGVLALLNRLTDWDPGPRVFIGTALLIVGLGLGVAAFAGGRSAKGGLIALGVVLSVALLFASTVPWRGVHAGIGDRTYEPTTAAAVRSSYDLGVGDVRIDLSRVDVSDLDEPIDTSVNGGLGDVDVFVPEDADVRLEINSGLGDVSVNMEDTGDGFYPGEGSGAWVRDDDPEIVLTINAGVGDVEVSRA